jgi:aspartokinase
MITVPTATKTVIQRSRYLSEALSKNLINYSSLARYIKPELENMLGKKISDASVLMAIQRISKDFKPKYSSENIFNNPPSLTIHSGLFLLTYIGNQINLVRNTGDFVLMTHGINETTLVANAKLQKQINESLNEKLIKTQINNLVAITIELPKQATKNPSVYYFFLKSLAWEGINVMQIFTTAEELTFIVTEKDLKTALGIIQSLFNKLGDKIS